MTRKSDPELLLGNSWHYLHIQPFFGQNFPKIMGGSGRLLVASKIFDHHHPRESIRFLGAESVSWGRNLFYGGILKCQTLPYGFMG